MTARTTMAGLITSLRGMTNAGTADYTIAGQAYWTDDQLQTILDRYRADVYNVDMDSLEQTASDGTQEWKVYSTDLKWLETSSGGSAIFYLQYAGGSVIPAASYSVDYERGIVTFTGDTGGVTVEMTARSYDIYAAAADVWQQKAAQAAMAIDFSTDNHSVKRSHVAAMYQKMADKFTALSNTGSGSGDMIRGDLR